MEPNFVPTRRVRERRVGFVTSLRSWCKQTLYKLQGVLDTSHNGVGIYKGVTGVGGFCSFSFYVSSAAFFYTVFIQKFFPMADAGKKFEKVPLCNGLFMVIS